MISPQGRTTLDSRNLMMEHSYVQDLSKRLRRIQRFVRRNIRDFGSVDQDLVRRKFRNLVKVHLSRGFRVVVGLVLGVVVVPVVRLLRPIVLIRFGSINTTRLGHMLIDVEMATAEKECGFNTQHSRTIDLWYPWRSGVSTANSQLLRMWKRSVNIVPAVPFEGIAQLNGLIPGGEVHKIPYRKGNRALSNFNDVHGALRTTQPHLKFTHKELDWCKTNLRDLGINQSDKYVCVHVRTSDYLIERLGKENSSGHDFRDAQIGDHFDAMIMLADRGYKVVRMGTESDSPLTISHPNLIDYANSGKRSELMDLYLPTRCDFFVGVLSGPSHIAQLFRKPLLLTNLVPLSRMMLSMDNFLFIPKSIVDKHGMQLSLREIVDSGLENLTETKDYERNELKVVDNSAAEIVEAVKEMADRVSGEFRESDSGLVAQSRFIDLVPDYLKVGAGTGRIASSFLSSNPWFVN